MYSLVYSLSIMHAGIFTCSCKKGLNNMEKKMPARAAWAMAISQLEAMRPSQAMAHTGETGPVPPYRVPGPAPI